MTPIAVVFMGVAYAGMPGPVNIETFRRGLGDGLHHALAVQSGAWLSRLIYAALVYFGAGLVELDDWTRSLITLIGAIVLAYSGIKTLLDAGRLGLDEGVTASHPSRAIQTAAGSGVLMALASPYAVLFWISVPFMAEYRFLGGIEFLLCFFAGTIVASFLWVFVANLSQGHLAQRLGGSIAWLCGLALIGYALKLIVDLLSNPVLW